MKITVTAPTRIDLAGGTLDLYPLFLFLDNPLTVNASISLRSRAVVTPLPGTKVRVIAEDIGESEEADSPQELTLGSKLDLINRAIRFYAPGGGLELRTRNTTPHGSGLGASSSLLMSMSLALGTFAGRQDEIEDIIHWGCELESQCIRVPAGLQDYYGACLGGIKGLRFGVAGTDVSMLHSSEKFQSELEESLVVSFTGVSHFSGANNWEQIKRFIDDIDDTKQRFFGIKKTSEDMWKALVEENLQAVGEALDEEWRNRCGLSAGVTTPRIDAMMAAAREAGAYASKLCGAGGGGCMMTLAAPGKRQAVIDALQKAGAEVLDAKLDNDRIKLQRED